MSAVRLVTLDLGNTKAALRVWPMAAAASTRSSATRQNDPPESLARARLATSDDLDGLLAEWLERVGGADHAVVSSVADRALTARVVASLERLCPASVSAPPSPGLEIAVDRPDTVGEDRLFAARGAVELVGGPAVVVDVGTALTVDAVGWTPSGGVFLGGAIAPGPALCAEALARGGSRLPDFEPTPGAPALGRDTLGALRAGVSAAVLGAARLLVHELCTGAELRRFLSAGRSPTVVVTGGARAFLGEPALFEGARDLPETRVRPDLVHEGLLAAWREGR